HRLRSREGLTLSGIATEVVHLRHSLEAVAAKVRRHEEEIRRLRRAMRRSRPTDWFPLSGKDRGCPQAR
ncbi:MAG: hypothetical protein ACYCTE_14430, partial [Acidimicrobiales bacterium]